VGEAHHAQWKIQIGRKDRDPEVRRVDARTLNRERSGKSDPREAHASEHCKKSRAKTARQRRWKKVGRHTLLRFLQYSPQVKTEIARLAFPRPPGGLASA